MTTAQSYIAVETKLVPPLDPTLPPLAIQVTLLLDTYMLWIGTTEEAAEDVYKAPLQGRLAKDWACAMPPSSLSADKPQAATSLYRTASSDAALSMSQRLARRFKKQIFLSIDLPPGFDSMGQGQKLVLAVETAMVEMLQGVERRQA